MRISGAALLAADTKHLMETTAIGLEKTLFARAGPFKAKTEVHDDVDVRTPVLSASTTNVAAPLASLGFDVPKSR